MNPLTDEQERALMELFAQPTIGRMDVRRIPGDPYVEAVVYDLDGWAVGRWRVTADGAARQVRVSPL